MKDKDYVFPMPLLVGWRHVANRKREIGIRISLIEARKTG